MSIHLGRIIEKERRKKARRGNAKQKVINTLFKGESLFNSLAHTKTTVMGNTRMNRAHYLFKLLIKRLAPSSYALKLAKGSMFRKSCLS